MKPFISYHILITMTFKFPHVTRCGIYLTATPDIANVFAMQAICQENNDSAYQIRHYGIECMDTGAACSTYTALSTDGREVVAALLLP